MLDKISCGTYFSINAHPDISNINIVLNIERIPFPSGVLEALFRFRFPIQIAFKMILSRGSDNTLATHQVNNI